ncbi:hypothetical protein FIBSPDRAFT_1038697 [Athelia psychrophila]|uniref:DUF6533 domain-containing protein n=1 Tax=Athelia psychrophila TaxID=1759441 RepID=A0A166SNK5_9AGAM|nr:hypothetical protein FIBSPDRAFT_1038697 [Fibularhizoctonia sp. CBS 109695]
MPQSLLPQGAEKDVFAIYQTRYMGFAAFSILVWDHILTFPDEVTYIWKGRKTLLTYLFLINRYLMPLGFIVNLVAYTLQSWGMESLRCLCKIDSDGCRCNKYVRYEGVMTATGVEIVGVMMLIRIHALYMNRPWVSRVVGSILLVEAAMNVYLLIDAEAVQHWSPENQGPSYPVHSCSMIYHTSHVAASASAWLPLLYDTIVFLLTLHRAIPSFRTSYQTGDIIRTMFRDGLLYYVTICAVTLTLTLMIVLAPPGVQNMTAQLELLITVTMMSRITLSLRKRAQTHLGYPGSFEDPDMPDEEITFTCAAQRASIPPLPVIGARERYTQNLARPSIVHFKPSQETRSLGIYEMHRVQSLPQARYPIPYEEESPWLR